MGADNQMLKKSILWNVVQPGDPYDIKKSMIARLPGDNRPFMGNKLQLVCLLQAAEIERLALNLQEYRVRFYQVEKGSLDRHSYEIQIKELADKLQSQESLRNQNAKLKKFSERLNQQLEQTKVKYSSGSTQLNLNYQQALLQIQTLSEQQERLTADNHSLKLSITARNTENQELQKKITKLQEIIEQYHEYLNKMKKQNSQGNTLTVPNQRSVGVPPRSPGPPRNRTTSIIVEPEKPINTSNKGHSSVIRGSNAGVPPRSPGPPRNRTTSIIVEPEKPINTSNKGHSSVIRGSNASSGKDKIVQLNQSTIYFKSEKALEASSIAVSAIRVKGFEGQQYEGRKVKRFQIAADIPEKELIKESNYFDQSNGDIGVTNLVPAKYGNFSLGEFNQINTSPVKTYLFDVALNERLQA